MKTTLTLMFTCLHSIGCSDDSSSIRAADANSDDAALTDAASLQDGNQLLPDAQVALERGAYEVPVSRSLAAAAHFPLPDVHWTIVNNTAELEYDLPLGLVGGPIKVKFEGPADLLAGTAHITGDNGSGDCTFTDTEVLCTEVFVGLGRLPISMDVVESVAAAEYIGPVQDRVDVATVFATDPLGIAKINLTVPPQTEDD